MATLNEIEQLSKTFAAHRNELADVVGALTEAIEALKRKHLPVIKRRVEAAAEARAALKAALEDSAGLFVKPRTLILHGIKVGFQKGKGKIEWEDADQVVKLIKKHFPEQADVLILTKEKPAKEALEQLTAAELKKLGIEVADSGDVVVIKDTASDIDKLVTALLKDAAEEVEA
jgi:hypothetical protein